MKPEIDTLGGKFRKWYFIGCGYYGSKFSEKDGYSTAP